MRSYGIRQDKLTRIGPYQERIPKTHVLRREWNTLIEGGGFFSQRSEQNWVTHI